MNSVVTFPERLLPSRRAAGALRGGGEGEAAGRTRATGEERGRRRRRRRTRLRNMAARPLLGRKGGAASRPPPCRPAGLAPRLERRRCHCHPPPPPRPVESQPRRGGASPWAARRGRARAELRAPSREGCGAGAEEGVLLLGRTGPERRRRRARRKSPARNSERARRLRLQGKLETRPGARKLTQRVSVAPRRKSSRWEARIESSMLLGCSARKSWTRKEKRAYLRGIYICNQEHLDYFGCFYPTRKTSFFRGNCLTPPKRRWIYPRSKSTDFYLNNDV